MRILVLLLIIFGISNCIRLIILYKEMKLKNNLKQNCALKSFLIIIPVYKEQTRIEECITAIEQLEYRESKVKIVFCTTEKEKDQPTTEQVIKRILNDKITKYHYLIIRYPNCNGNMAEQVNYAYEQCNENEDIIGIYNADSKPERDTLLECSCAFEKKEVEIIQQWAVYFANPPNNILSTGYIYFQSIFELTKNLWKSIKGKSYNVCGRALFLRNGTITNGIFPTNFFCEDIALSTINSNLNKKVYTIKSFEINESPPNFLAIINQQYVWFSTAWSIKKLYKHVKRYNKISYRLYTFLFYRLLRNITWLGLPLILILSSLYNPNFLVLIYLYSLMACLLVNKIVGKSTDIKSILYEALSLTINLFTNNIGPLKYLLHCLVKRFDNRLNIIKYKTPR